MMENPQPLFNGYLDTFGPGKVVLDIASGEAVAATQLTLAFPDATIIGVDILYQTERRVFPNRAGLQLTHGDWRELTAIPSGSVDTILSCQGLTMWGLPIGATERTRGNDISEDDGFRIIKTLNRISKPGTVIRFDSIEKDTFLRANLGSNWNILPHEHIFIARREE